MERHRLLILVNQSEDIFTGKDVLHFAPEPVVSNLVAASAKNYLTADVVPGRADCVLNIEQIEQPDASWDVAICSHVLEHVDDRTALAELYRILRKNGRLVVMAPVIEGWDTTYENPSISTDQEREIHFGQHDHVRYYGRDIRKRIAQAGFEVHEYTAYGSAVVQYGLSRGGKLFICTK
ncbi:MAG: methyltransferase domain-containing protein [Anaerolineae bacterium]|nr:methyltransferase domain-containing protein [Anaerolineae bacterium]